MTTIRKVCTLLTFLTLSACAGVEPASRNTNPSQSGLALVAQPPAQMSASPRLQILQSKYQVAEIRVNVPRTLKVSEANTFLPKADIVWRGEPRADRHAQVA